MVERENDNYDIEKLKKFRMPVIKSVNQLLSIFKFSQEDEKRFFKLFTIAEWSGTSFYYQFPIRKSSGGIREIEKLADEKVRFVQETIDRMFLRRFPVSKKCHSYLKNRSIVTNAREHLGAKIIMKFDISNFFPSIRYNRVVSIFMNMGYGKNVAKFLSFFCVNNKFFIPQGAITSPMISNIACSKLDKRINSYCISAQLSYTRYADDITISSKNKLTHMQCFIIKNKINEIISSEGFIPNEKKFHWFKEGQKMMVTGVVINNNMLSPKKEVIEELEKALYFSKKYGFDSFLNYMNEHREKDKPCCHRRVYNYFYIERLFGLAYFVHMIDSSKGEYYISELKKNFPKEYDCDNYSMLEDVSFNELEDLLND